MQLELELVSYFLIAVAVNIRQHMIHSADKTGTDINHCPSRFHLERKKKNNKEKGIAAVLESRCFKWFCSLL